MKRKGKLRKAIFSLAICVGIFCAWSSVLLLFGEYSAARHKLDIRRQELQAWEACRQTKPSYFKSNSETVSACLKNYNEARDNPWMSLPKERLVGLFVLAAVGSAAVGCLATWIIVWLGVLAICKVFGSLLFCFRHHPTRQVQG